MKHTQQLNHVYSENDHSLLNINNSSSTYSDCSSFDTCDKCRSNYRCHFCEKDYQCHAVGSPSGCIVGIQTCHHIEDCVRDKPEYIGYGPTPAVVASVLCSSIILACLAMLLSSACSYFCKNRSTASTENDHIEIDDSSQGGLDSNQRLLKVDQVEAQMEGSPRYGVGNSRNQASTCFKYSVCFILLGSFMALGLTFFPRIPDYNICNRNFDWESIFQSLRSISPKIKYEVLLSISNENRFAFELEHAVARIHHDNITVGFWQLNDTTTWTAEAGSISDLLLTLHIEPGFTEGISLWKAFLQNTLVFKIDADVRGSIKLGDHRLYSVSSSVQDLEFFVGDVTPRNLCQCTEYFGPTQWLANSFGA